MNAVLHAGAVYAALLLIFRLFGKRSLAQITTFDFVMLLIVAETTQQALLGDDFSITNAVILIVTLFVLDAALDRMKRRWPWFSRTSEGVPLIVVVDGKPLEDRLRHCRIDESDILAAARERQGLERMEQIKFAVLEKNGAISIIPKDGA